MSRFPSRPPLGLAYIAGALKRAGYESHIVDMQVDDTDIQNLIGSRTPKLIGFSITTWTFKQVLEEVKRLKHRFPHLVFVAGGPHATALPEQMLGEGFDVVVRGYGEETIVELVENLDRPNLWANIAGLSYKHQGTIQHNPKRNPPKSLEGLPFPSFDLLNIERYKWCSISSSRGCSARCLFCADSHLFANRVLLRSAQNFVDELEWLYKEKGIRKFYFVDEQFTFDNFRAQQICRDIIQRGMKIEWLVNSRVDRVTPDLLHLMKQAGCVSIAFGVESGSDAILRRIRKGTRSQTALAAVRMAKAANIRVKTSWIVGLPGTFEEQLESIDLMRSMEPNHIDVFLLTIYPGTPLWRRAKEFGITIDENDPPMMSTDKLNSDRYHLDYLSNEEIIQIVSKMEAAMMDRGYQISSPGKESFDPQSKVMTTFLRHFKQTAP
ncbi:MAG: B12-binding domain-containing radical SAM protein [Chloroflexi bacterium]|nr:B12-binding domain-containing radical SAM protein [Chloroflexota bacterium]